MMNQKNTLSILSTIMVALVCHHGSIGMRVHGFL